MLSKDYDKEIVVTTGGKDKLKVSNITYNLEMKFNKIFSPSCLQTNVFDYF